MLLCGLTLALGYANKARCVGPYFDSLGSQRARLRRPGRPRRLLLRHPVSVDRPRHRPARLPLRARRVRPGHRAAVRRRGGVPGAHRDGDLPGGGRRPPPTGTSCSGPRCCWPSPGLLTAALLAWLAGLRSWWFALAPPLVLYAFHNWDLFAVCADGGRVLGAAARRVGRPAAGRRRGRPLVVAAVALGVGAAFKIYPMMFALPVALWLGTGGGGRCGGGGAPRRRRWLRRRGVRGRHRPRCSSLINLPFMIAGWPAGGRRSSSSGAGRST